MKAEEMKAEDEWMTHPVDEKPDQNESTVDVGSEESSLESFSEDMSRTSVLAKHGAPWLHAMSWVYLVFPVSYTIFVGLLFDIPFGKLLSLFFSPFFYVLCGLAVVTGYSLMFRRRWSYQFAIVTHVFILISNASLIIRISETHHPFSAFWVGVAVLGFLTWILRSELKKPYIIPRIRWWESDYEQSHVVPVKVSIGGKADQIVEGELMDLSVDGAFIRLGSWPPCEELVNLSFEVFHKRLQLQGTVVWLAEERVVHPKGIGVKFVPMGRQERRRLRLAVYRIERALGLRKRKSLSAREMELQRWFKLQTRRLQRRFPQHKSALGRLVAKVQKLFQRN